MRNRQHRAVLLLFFLSGITGLVYEVLWVRMLTSVFGHTIYAVSTVLTAFMAGLGLGAWLFGRYADRFRKPLKAYSLLEWGIGLFALAVPWIFGSLDALFRPVYQALNTSFTVFSLIRFAVCFTVLLIPTTLMGATLPVLSKAVATRFHSLGKQIGGLYAVNTLGAVSGCFLTGFVLIETLGIRNTIHCTAALNILLALAAWWLSARTGEAPEPVFEPGTETTASRSGMLGSTGVRILLACFCLSGFVALALEVIWTRALVFSFFQGSSTYAFTAMLTIFLLGLGAGSFLFAPFADRIANPVRLFGWMEVAIGLFAAISLPLLLHLGREHVTESLGTSWLAGISQDFFKSFLVMIVPTLIMGAAFPVVTRIYLTHARTVSRGVGSLYSLNTLGAIAGSFGAGFVLVPLLGMARGLSILATLSLLAGAAILLLDRQSAVRGRIASAVVPAVCVAAVLLLAPAQARFQQVGDEQEILYYREGSNGTVSVVEFEDDSRWVVIDNVWVAGTSLGMMTDQKSLAHIPALFHRDPKRVLTVGFGSGGASWSFTTHPNLAEIHCVELAPEVVDAHTYFPDCNFTLFEDDRYRIIFDDAKSYLLLGEPEYDTISTDCTDLRYKSNADLYTLDYFLTCKRKLRDDGLLVAWMPLTGLTEEYYRVVLSTFAEAFPNGTLWYFTNYITNYILLIGSEEPLAIDWQALNERLDAPAVRQDLAMIRLDDPYKLVSGFLMDAPALREFVKGYDLNTDDLPLVEFGVPKSPPVDFMNNLAMTMRFQGRVEPPVINVPDEERERFEATLARYVDAGRELSRGHIHYWRNEKDAARHLYLRALQLTPEDESLRILLGLSANREEELLSRAEENPDDPRPAYNLALLYWETGRRDEALSRLEALARSNPEFLSAPLGLGRRLHELGRHREASRILDALQEEARGSEAETAVRRVIEVGGHLEKIGRSQDDEPVLELADLLLGYGDLYEAITVLEREVEKRRSVPLLDRLAYLYLAAGLTDDVERVARMILELDPERPEAHYYLAQVHLKWNELEEAEQEYLSVSSPDTRNPHTWYLGAIIHHRRGKEPEAVAALRKAFDLGGAGMVERARRDPVFEGSPVLEEALRSPGNPG